MDPDWPLLPGGLLRKKEKEYFVQRFHILQVNEEIIQDWFQRDHQQ